MSILSKLPLIGRGMRNRSFKPSFKVEFGGGKEGLERLVDVAISPEKSTIILAEAHLPEPVARLDVYLQSGSGHLAYILEAKLVPYSGQKLQLDQRCFAGFEVYKYNLFGGDVKVYSLRSHMLPDHSPIRVSIGKSANKNDISLYNHVPYGRDKSLIQNEVKDALTAFANVLEATVNSAYRSAGKPSPKEAVSLHILRRS